MCDRRGFNVPFNADVDADCSTDDVDDADGTVSDDANVDRFVIIRGKQHQ